MEERSPKGRTFCLLVVTWKRAEEMATEEDNLVCVYGSPPRHRGYRSTSTLRQLQIEAKGTISLRNLCPRINQGYFRTQETGFTQLEKGGCWRIRNYTT